jgi:hypothetical protein
VRELLLLLLAAATSGASPGCARESHPARAPSVGLPQLPPRPDFDPDAARVSAGGEIQLTGLLAAPAISNREQGLRVGSLKASLFGARASSSAYNTNAPDIDRSVDPAHSAKIEVEAQIAVDVANVSEAAAQVLAFVREHKGSVAKDERQSATTATADLLVRVPSADFDAFVRAIGRLGDVRMQRVRSIDATLEHRDMEVLLENLEAAQARYRDLLAKATDVGQILPIERELERVRTDLERIHARLDYLRDRVAYATIAIGLHAFSPEPSLSADYQARFATGVRALSRVDVRESGTDTYGGAGLTLRLPRGVGDPPGRGLALDIDVMRACCNTTPLRDPWSYDVLLGFDLFSEALESGRREGRGRG